MTQLIQPICYPQPCSDESPVGYLIRVCQANQFNNIRWMYPAEGKAFSLRPSEILERLVSSPWTGFEQIQESILPFSSLSPIELNTTSLRYCPVCISEKPYFPVSRHVKCTTVCTVHRCWLIDRCSECRELMEYGRLTSITECRCGHPLKNAEVNSVPKEVVRFQEFIDGVEEYSDTDSFWLGKDLCPTNFGLKKRIELAFGFTQWQPVEMNAFSRSGTFAGFSDIETAKPYVLAAAKVFFSDNDRFTPFLHQLHQQVYEDQDEGDKLFKRFYKYYFRHIGGMIDPLYSSMERYMNLNWHYSFSQKNSLFSDSMIEGHHWIPLQAACKRFELGKKELSRAILSKSVRAREKHYRATDRTFTLVYQPDVMRYVYESANLVNGVTAASILGVTKKQFYQLVDNHVIQGQEPSKLSGSTWKFERSHLQELLEKFTKVLPVLDDRYVPLSDAVRKVGNRIPSPFVSLLLAIEKGDIEAKVNSQSVGLRQLCLLESSLKDWYQNQTSKNRLYTASELATELQVLPDLISGLIRVSILHTCHVPEVSAQRITGHSVQQFKDRYVILSKLAKCSGMSSQNMRSVIKACNISAIDEDWALGEELSNRVYYRHELLSKKELAPLVASMNDWEYLD